MLETLLFWPSALVAVFCSVLVILSNRPVYAVLYLVLSLLAVSVVIYTLGAAPLAVFEVIVYAGAIMVFFLFVVMMLNLGTGHNREDLKPAHWKAMILPGTLTGIIFVGMFLAISNGSASGVAAKSLTLEVIGRDLFTHGFLGVKLASLVLLVATVGGMHLGSAADKKIENQSTDEKSGVSHGR